MKKEIIIILSTLFIFLLFSTTVFADNSTQLNTNNTPHIKQTYNNNDENKQIPNLNSTLINSSTSADNPDNINFHKKTQENYENNNLESKLNLSSINPSNNNEVKSYNSENISITNQKNLSNFTNPNYSISSNTYSLNISYDNYSINDFKSINTQDLRDETKIITNDFKELYGENNIYNATLINEKKTLNNQNIQITINGKTYYKITDENGNLFLNINLLPGVYNVTSYFKGNNLYKPTISFSTITILPTNSKINTHLIGSILFENAGENLNYEIQLLDNNNIAITNQMINFKINGISYTRQTNNNGIAQLAIRLNPGIYDVEIYYRGNNLYTPIAPQTYTIFIYMPISKLNTSISEIEFNSIYGENNNYKIKLKDQNGNPLINQKVCFEICNMKYYSTTNNNGIAQLAIRLNPGIYSVNVSYEGNCLYNFSKLKSTLKILSVIILGNLTNYDLQSVINSIPKDTALKLSSLTYNNISLTINKSITLTTTVSRLIGDENKTILTLNSDNIIIDGFELISSNGKGIIIHNDNNKVLNCNIKNNISSDLLDSYNSGELTMPGEGIGLIESNNIIIDSTTISNYYHGVFIEKSDNITITNNNIIKNNYGIEFGYNSSNTLIENNQINENIGFNTMTLVEGPLGYGISIRHSGINVTILNNNINNNYMGIFIDAENCTGIVIVGNEITNSVIEGLTFNENYTFAENAIQPLVENNAIYNNAKGPSMIQLGEVSANPEGIYGPGEWDNDKKLYLGANWYGENRYITWGNITGPGTICPRINTTLIQYELISMGNGKYQVTFYNNGIIASALPDFTTFFTLNFYTDKEIEKEIIIHNGIGILEFPNENYYKMDNIIEGSSGSLFDTSRRFNIIYTYYVPDEEIPL